MPKPIQIPRSKGLPLDGGTLPAYGWQRKSGVPVVRWQGCSPEKCKSSRLKTCAVH